MAAAWHASAPAEEVHAWAKGEILRLKWEAGRGSGGADGFAQKVVAAVGANDAGLADVLRTALAAYQQLAPATAAPVTAVPVGAALRDAEHEGRQRVGDEEAAARAEWLYREAKGRARVEHAADRRRAEGEIKGAMAQIHEMKALLAEVLSSVELLPPGSSRQSSERLGDELTKSEQARSRLVAELQVAHEALNIQATYLTKASCQQSGDAALLRYTDPLALPPPQPPADPRLDPPPRPPPPPPRSPPSACTAGNASPLAPPPPTYEPWQHGGSVWTPQYAPASAVDPLRPSEEGTAAVWHPPQG
eukprot:TRINITY_DN27372_c0_g1_i1.p1 TRINITY_DN27372_c0_g1~~TRINITY_DN27372_c0_g1_i1.p1  ORF type:complete len:326 (+),score=81.32 TRINITY_DN27372_c0_g1_i1:65-979(+)